MMEKLSQCPICYSDQLKILYEIPDHFGDKELFQLSRCNNCQTLLTNPRPNEINITKYYKSNTYVSHGDSKGGLFDLLYRSVQYNNFKYKEKLVQRYSIGKNLLDYGCGAGRFIQYLDKQGYTVEGIEPDSSARALASKTVHVKETIDQVLEQSFDVITLYHVLEHVHEIEITLGKLKSILSKNGTIHLALPNYESYDAQHYKAYWAGYDVPRHLYHFNQRSVVKLAETHGFKVLASHPLKFDSYYVSLLSEQYKKSKLASVNAFWHGYRSNYKARKTGEYSSLIYILTH